MRDPGLFTDSTGEGMAGATDVSQLTQQNLGKTLYNGSKACKGCGSMMDPHKALLSELCPACNNKRAVKHLKNRMA